MPPALPFVIDSEDKANWFLAKLANIRAEQARVKAQAERRIAELEPITPGSPVGSCRNSNHGRKARRSAASAKK
jgi:hypothetical protein